MTFYAWLEELGGSRRDTQLARNMVRERCERFPGETEGGVVALGTSGSAHRGVDVSHALIQEAIERQARRELGCDGVDEMGEMTNSYAGFPLRVHRDCVDHGCVVRPCAEN